MKNTILLPQSSKFRTFFSTAVLFTLSLIALQASAESGAKTRTTQDHASALSATPSPYLDDETLPGRTKPLLELGPKFLSTGNISSGFELPTGAVWTPSLWVYGTFRSALQHYDQGEQEVSEWANRLDLFANLQLSGTERILIGFTPLHNRDTGLFSGEIFAPTEHEQSINELNLELDTLFFEGDLAELFPNWDYSDSKKNDIGFTIGRQNVVFGEGFLVNDSLDGIGFSKNNIRFENNPNIINWRSSLFIGFNGVHRSDNIEDDDSQLIGWFNQVDTTHATYNLDVVYVDAEQSGDLLNIGIDATLRLGKTNATFRAAVSNALDQVTAQSDDGTLLFTELSWIPKHTHDNLYLNAFIAIDNFTSAARGPLTGGALGRTGLLFAAQGIGSFPAPLSNQARDASGVALGYQRFTHDKRTQFSVEAGARFEDQANIEDEIGLGFRLQKAIGHRAFWQIDGFATKMSGSDTDFGVRLELQIKL